MASWVQHPITGELIPKDQYVRPRLGTHTLFLSPEAYKSPIDGTVIDDRATLREHNKRHGVTDVRDYGGEYFDRKHKERSAEMQGTTPAAKRERKEALNRTIEMMGSRE